MDSLVESVIQVESGGNPNAQSKAGAKGLMQLMDATAKELGVTDSFDPEQNKAAGTKYLGQLLNKYNNNLEHALMAYNWGMGNVDSLLQTGTGLNGRSIPKETRDYVKKVLAGMKN